MRRRYLIAALALTATVLPGSRAADPPAAPWKLGSPIVTYWAGPGFPGGAALDDAAAKQMVEGGWNLAWCHEKELAVAQRHGLRGLLTDPLLAPSTLDDPKKREKLDALIDRVRKQPALYAYQLVDEPGADKFAALGKFVAYLREKDPAHLAYINLLPIYASNEQLGTKGTPEKAYAEYLRKFVDAVKPGLLSYDHYQFRHGGDGAQYFQNLAMIREQALAADVPFMNIVQAASWVPGTAASPKAPRVPNGDEMRYLVYTSLAYGARAISYYVYCYPGHEGGIVRADNTPTPLYHALKPLNREFATIAKELQPLKSLGAYHAGMLPPGVTPLAKETAFTLDPPVPAVDYKDGDRVQGVLLGRFGPKDGKDAAGTHALVVNLDYKAVRRVSVRGPAPLEVFDAGLGQWSAVGGEVVKLRLGGGEGVLVRVRP